MTSIAMRPPLSAVGRKPRAAAMAGARPGLELLAAAVGVLGVIHDSRSNSSPASWMSLHSLFGVLLWLSVIERFRRRFGQLTRGGPAGIRAFSRRLSRRVYLLLYGLVFLSLTLGVVRSASHGPAFSECARGYLAWGIAALATIHALSALCLRFLIVGGGGKGRLTYGESANPKRQG